MISKNRELYTVHFQPSGLKCQVSDGATLLEAAQQCGIYLSSICGGDGCCGKCKVVVNEGLFNTRGTTLLTPEELRDNVVLACQAIVQSPMTVTVPRGHRLEAGQILIDDDARRFGQLAGETRGRAFPPDPLVRKLELEMTPPSLSDHTADQERLYLAIRDRIEAPVIQTGYRILQKLSPLVRQSDYRITATVARRGATTELVDLEPSGRGGANYALVVDLGTTTVVAHLVDPDHARTLDTEATYNSQICFGEDYIRRIIYGEQNDCFDELQERIVADVNSLIMTLAVRRGIDLRDITACICAGNTAMLHFLLKLDPTLIRREPYVPSAEFIPPIRAAEVGIQINKRGLLYCLPSVSAYIGSDIVAGVLATGMYDRPGLYLFADIGTNGEVVLGGRDWLLCASSSAGPAFEGSGVKHGMRAGRGAIEAVSFRPDGSVHLRTIGDASPAGICGSGLLDTLAGLYTNGIIDRTGRFTNLDDSRIAESSEGWEFELAPSNNGADPVAITQADIYNLIRSKAGIFAAVRVLLQAAQAAPDQLDGVFLAGGFGNFLDVRRAIEVGLLPDVDPDRIHFVGNTTVAGAKAALTSRHAWQLCEHIATTMTYFDLMTAPDYMEEFIRARFLPHTDMTLFPSVTADSTETPLRNRP